MRISSRKVFRWPLWALLLCACEAPATLSGRAIVVDGDSLEIGATSIRLYAIDAPEGRQTCQESGAAWACGEAAARKLRELVADNVIACTQKDTDSYGRTVAVCDNGSVDLGAAMVAGGWALAYRQFDDRYVDEEAAARAARRGLWAGEFAAPWEWRRQEGAADRTTAAGAAAAGCRIKGNINQRGERIYHVPDSRSYADTRIDESRGERWFCSEGEAQRDGWRAPRGR